ncbi:hypothetical protein [Acidisphaera sp. L21]|uniref:hypothetical protein n=1 Tax=Acidisphaera sp. L21 TaxID=1641851 RepID=UPI00131EC362|nr:hypothetical protein [Acidisphaera sp. L21]
MVGLISRGILAYMRTSKYKPGVRVLLVFRPRTRLLSLRRLVDGKPTGSLDYWSLLEVQRPRLPATWHAHGLRGDGSAWITSNLIAYDPGADLIQTATGSVYSIQEIAPPGSTTPALEIAYDTTIKKWGLLKDE